MFWKLIRYIRNFFHETKSAIYLTFCHRWRKSKKLLSQDGFNCHAQVLIKVDGIIEGSSEGHIILYPYDEKSLPYILNNTDLHIIWKETC